MKEFNPPLDDLGQSRKEFTVLNNQLKNLDEQYASLRDMHRKLESDMTKIVKEFGDAAVRNALKLKPEVT